MNSITIRLLGIGVLISLLFSCTSPQTTDAYPHLVYKSAHLMIQQIAPNTFEHISYLQTESFGKVACNGLILRDEDEVIIFDTTTENASSEELINWVNTYLKCKIKAVIPTHFHEDNLGGLKAFHQRHIPSFSYFKTLTFAKEHQFELPQHGFNDSLKLKLGKHHVWLRFMGEGHTRDNIIGYFSQERVLFGGCLVKELQASKGYLGDANETEWSNTIRRIKKAFPAAEIIVPGHGTLGGRELLDYTENLFQRKK